MRERVCHSESDVKKYVKKILDDHGWKWWMPPANGFGQAGISDFNALRSGVFLAVETKFYARSTGLVGEAVKISSTSDAGGN